MTVEILPQGIKCNLSCSYCYQEPMRKAGNLGAPLNFLNVKKAVEEAQQDFSIFGGEPLLTPLETLDRLWSFGYCKFKKNGIQTNGLLINDAHIELFKKYNVQVGISIDGPEELNTPRCGYKETAVIIRNIKRLAERGVYPSLIITIHKQNTRQIGKLLDFLDDMQDSGIRYINLHNLEDDNGTNLVLSDEDNLDAFKTIYEYCKDKRFHALPFKDIERLLTIPAPSVSCIWTGCDPLTTPAVHGIGADGSLTNCGRTNKEGIDWIKADGRPTKERYAALWRSDCKGCKYFFVCKGNCPGTAIDGDWRRKTKDCLFWYGLIDYIAKDLKETLDLGLENQRFVQSISASTDGQTHGDSPHGDYHGDHTDSTGVGRRFTS